MMFCLELFEEEEQSHVDWVKEHQTRLTYAYKKARYRLEQEESSRKDFYNRKAKSSTWATESISETRRLRDGTKFKMLGTQLYAR